MACSMPLGGAGFVPRAVGGKSMRSKACISSSPPRSLKKEAGLFVAALEQQSAVGEDLVA